MLATFRGRLERGLIRAAKAVGGNAGTAPRPWVQRPWVQLPFDTETQTLWDRVRSHILIIDDYGDWAGAKKAVDEYFVEIRPRPLLHRIDGTGR